MSDETPQKSCETPEASLGELPPVPSAIPPPVPPATEKQAPGLPPLPATEEVVKDPSWWRLRTMPFVALLLAAVAGDLLWPRLAGLGLGAGLGVVFGILAILLLRKDLSRGERCFLVGLAAVSFAGLVLSGSSFLWLFALVLPLLLVMTPGKKQFAQPGVRYRSWWSFWVAKRSGDEGRGCRAWLRQLLPTFVCLLVGGMIFVLFLLIFASGNPVVLLVWKSLSEAWNQLVEWLRLDWDFAWHVCRWLVGVLAFGLFAFARPPSAASLPEPEFRPKSGRALLPLLPLASLVGVNLAFLVANAADISYLWLARAPEGVSQTEYLHEGASSIACAAVLAALLLLFLFRRHGSARGGRASRVTACLLVFQTFLLAASVCLRLCHQIDDCGFTSRRVQAFEALLLGLVGLVFLGCDVVRCGSFRKYARRCLGSVLLLFLAFGVRPPAELAGDLNLRFVGSRPQWEFSPSDFVNGRFDAGANLAFAYYASRRESANDDMRPRVRPRGMGRAPVSNLERAFEQELRDAALIVEYRASHGGWASWNASLQRDIPAAEEILGRPVAPRAVESVH